MEGVRRGGGLGERRSACGGGSARGGGRGSRRVIGLTQGRPVEETGLSGLGVLPERELKAGV